MRARALIAGSLLGLAVGCASIFHREEPPSPAELAAVQQESQAAQAAFDLKDWPKAQAALLHLVALVPRSAEAHHRLGRVFQAQEQFGLAEDEFRKALTLDHDYVDALIGLGQVEAQTGRIVDGLRHLDQAIELDPSRGEAHIARGQAMETLGRPGDALTAYFRTLETDPNSATALKRVAFLQLDQGRYDQALTRLEQAIELLPDDPDARLLRGRAHLALHHLPDAVEDFRFAAEKLPNRPDAFYQLALALSASQKRGDAIKAAEKAVILAPEWAKAQELSQQLRR